MAEDMYVETGSITSQLGTFQDQMSQLETLFDKINGEIKDAKNNWEGAASEATLPEIEKLNNLFDSIKAKNKKYTEFLNQVVEKYTEIDELEQEFVQSNNDVFDTNM